MTPTFLFLLGIVVGVSIAVVYVCCLLLSGRLR